MHEVREAVAELRHLTQAVRITVDADHRLGLIIEALDTIGGALSAIEQRLPKRACIEPDGAAQVIV